MMHRPAARTIDKVIIVAILATLGRFAIDVAQPRLRAAQLELAPTIQTGTSFEIPGIDWSRADVNIVAVVGANCAPSKANASLYADLIRKTSAERRTRFILASSDPQLVLQKWSSENNLSTSPLITLRSSDKTGLFVTPTLMIVTNKGILTDVILGVVSAPDKTRLFERLSGAGRPFQTAERIDTIGLDRLRSTVSVQVIDIRDRDAYRGRPSSAVVNIPLNELVVRGQIELRPNDPIVIDCSRGVLRRCYVAGAMLTKLDIQNVFVFKPHSWLDSLLRWSQLS